MKKKIKFARWSIVYLVIIIYWISFCGDSDEASVQKLKLSSVILYVPAIIIMFAYEKKLQVIYGKCNKEG
jgi:hypothetical protein